MFISVKGVSWKWTLGHILLPYTTVTVKVSQHQLILISVFTVNFLVSQDGIGKKEALGPDCVHQDGIGKRDALGPDYASAQSGPSAFILPIPSCETAQSG